MRICHIQTRLLNGGADENTMLTCNHQALRGHDVLLVYGNESHPEILEQIHPEVDSRQIPDLRRSIHPIAEIKAIRQILRILKEFKPDIVHTHTSKAGILGRLCGRISKAPLIIHGVHILPFLNVNKFQEIIYLLAERWVARWTDHYICVSEALMEENIRYRIADRKKHSVVPSGMQIHRYKKAKKRQWEELLFDTPGAFRNRKSIVYVGALEPRKRQYELLDVFKEVLRKEPNTILVLVGGGKDRARIEQRIATLNLKEKVILTGFRKDVADLIRSADICVLASEREGLARVLIQYALAGRPIVTTSLPGVEVVVQNEKNGYVVPVNPLDSMIEPISTLLADDEKRDCFAKHSLKMDFSEWSVESMVNSIESIYGRTRRAKGLQRASF